MSDAIQNATVRSQTPSKYMPIMADVSQIERKEDKRGLPYTKLRMVTSKGKERTAMAQGKAHVAMLNVVDGMTGLVGRWDRGTFMLVRPIAPFSRTKKAS